MNAVIPLLAALEENQQVLIKKIGLSSMTQMTIIFAAIGVVIVLLFLFVYVFRNRLFRKRKRRHHHHHHSSAPAAPEENEPKRRKSRRLRREHRPLNPTLAQKGGLPPVRDPDQPPAGL
jgi:hypothetical protein